MQSDLSIINRGALKCQALSEARPLARRALIIARPLRVFILARMTAFTF